MKWMKMDDYSREAFSDEQVLVALTSGPVNGGMTGVIRFGSYGFFSKNVNTYT